MDAPLVWEPSGTQDPLAIAPVQQVQLMASIVLALLSEPTCEFHKLSKIQDFYFANFMIYFLPVF